MIKATFGSRGARFSTALFGLLTAAVLTPGIAWATDCTSTPINCSATGGGVSWTAGTNPSPATTYPSTALVAGMSGSVKTVSVTLNTLTPASGQVVADLAIMLVDPSGHELVMFANCGYMNTAAISFTVADTGSTYCITNGATLTGGTTYAPSSFDVFQDSLAWNGSGNPVPTDPVKGDYSAPDSTATFNTGAGAIFLGDSPNGTWSLYVFQIDADGTGNSGSLGSWSLNLTTTAGASTSTSVTSNPNPSFTATPNNDVTFTATVTQSSDSSPVTSGTVTFTDLTTNTVLQSDVPLSGSGQAVTTNTITFSTEGGHEIQAVYNNSTDFSTSNGTVEQMVSNHTTNPNTGQYCNPGEIALGDQPALGATPYPSNIFVPAMTGASVSDVSLQLSKMNGPGSYFGILLVGPGLQEFIPLMNAPSSSNIRTVSSVDLNLTDTGAPITSTLATGTFGPTASTPLATWPSPAPSATQSNAAGPYGTQSFLSTFGGVSLNSATTWQLYAVTDPGDGGSTPVNTITSGWCLTFITSTAPATTTTVTATPNPALTTSDVTLTATVTLTSNGTSVGSSGTVTFKDGSTVLQADVALVNGVATYSLNTPTEGIHAITAAYSGVPSTYNSSNGTLSLEVDHPTTNPSAGVYCNNGGDTLPAGVKGAATVYPSNIFVTGLAGTVLSVSPQLNALTYPVVTDVAALLKGPVVSPEPGNLLFLANADGGGVGSNAANSLNLTFADSASSLVPSTGNGVPAGTYKPTAYSTPDTLTFPSPAPSPQYAAPAGTGTFVGTFQNADPNTKWSLYWIEEGSDTSAGTITGWCLTFTTTPPVATITESGTTPVTQGQTGVQYTITVTDNGPGPTGSSTMTVTPSSSSGMTLTGLSSTDSAWTCGASNCTRTTPIALNNDTTITATYSVSGTASSPQTVGASVSGGGISATAMVSPAFPITVMPAPMLSVTKTAVGNFTQGSTAEWDVTVNNTAAAGGTTSGSVTVSDTLPAGYTVNAFTGTDPTWSCMGQTTQTATCTSTQQIGGGSSFPLIKIIVNVPANSATSVTNTANAWGGSDPVHTNSGTAAKGMSTVTVVQVPTQMTVVAGTSGQSATIQNAFMNLFAVTVLDAASNPVQGVQVTFTAPAQTGPSGLFFNGTGTTQATTGANGVATATTFTANTHASATSYNVVASATNLTSVNFSLTNNAGAPATLAITSGNGQSATVGVQFANPLTATVTDAFTNPVPNATVTFTAPASTLPSITFAGNVNTATTNASGVATSAAITANSHAGGPYNVGAAAGSASNNFSLTNNPGTAANIALTLGSGQSATVNTQFTNALTVTVTDGFSNPVPNATVTFTPPAQTGASITFAGNVNTATTNSSGVATSAAITANTHAGGPYNVMAAAGTGTNNFSLTNNPGTPATLAVTGGSPQSATVNVQFTNPLTATVTDMYSNPVPNQIVTFTPPAQTGASITFAGNVNTATTNSLGVATAAAITANTHAGGPYNVLAATGSASNNFSLTNNAGNPATLALTGGSGQSATVNTQFNNALTATVTDSFTNPVPNVTVTFTAPAQNGASITFAGNVNTAMTNALGVATSAAITANTHAGGPYNVLAAAGTASNNFSLTNLAGTASVVAVTSGSGQSATVTVNFTNPLVATVTDGFSNPISGVTVTFTAPSTGASGKFGASLTSTAMTGSNGQATSGTFTANTVAGGYNVVASAPGATSVNFAMTNLAGAAFSISATSGGGQSTMITNNFTNPLAATVLDQYTNPVSGTLVTFTAPSQAGASATFATTNTAMTNSSGVATSTTVSANSHVGMYTVAASASSGAVTGANFSLTNLPGPAAIITITGGNNQGVGIGTAFMPLQVTVTDAGMNPVANGTNVTFTAPVETTASGIFANNTNTITLQTGSGGAVSAAFTANLNVGLFYQVGVTSGSAPQQNFILTNQPVIVTGQVSVTTTGLIRNRSTGYYVGTMTVTNTSSSTIAGGVYVVMTNLTPGIVLENSTGTFGGNFYILVSSGALAPGASANVTIDFNNPGNVTINFTPVTYSGGV